MSEVIRGKSVRAKSSPALLEALAEQYGFKPDSKVKDLGGWSNLNLLVTNGAARYVARVYLPWVTAARLNAIQRARQHLADNGIPVALPVPTLNGVHFIEVEGRLVEVEPYVEHNAKMDDWPRLEIGMALLGRIHSHLKTLELDEAGRNAPASNSIEPAETFAATLRGTQQLRDWGATPDELQINAKAEALAYLLESYRAEVENLPRQLVHGDYWDNNVLFRDNKIVLVADLDFMGERARIDDVALTLYYINATFTEDTASEKRVSQLCQLVNAYNSGLDQPLSRAERLALPLALARVPLAFVSMLPVIDSKSDARALVGYFGREIGWALEIVRDLKRWQSKFVG